VNLRLLLIAIAAALAFFAGMNFILILIAAGFVYRFSQKKETKKLLLIIILFLSLFFWTISTRDTLWFKPFTEKGIQVNGNNYSAALVLVTGFKAGLLTFGGAYTAIPFVQQDALKYGWMTQQQFLDGIAISGILPAPLVIFTTFVGYFGAGWIGALLITIGVFLPAFSFTLIGFSVLEKLITNKSLHHFLDGITAAVVGFIGVTAMQLFYSTITGYFQLIIFLIALGILIKFRSKYTALIVILVSALAGLIWNQF
jgi:chromate transporter